MPLVFVHGVNVRKDAKGNYARAEKARNASFRLSVLKNIAVDPNKLTIMNPYWGDEASKFPWEHGGLPESDYEVFGNEEGLEKEEILPATILAEFAPEDLPGGDEILPWLAKRDFVATVDILFVVANDPALDEIDTDELAGLAERVGAYAQIHRNAPPDWLTEVSNNMQFVDMLVNNVRQHDQQVNTDAEKWEEFGLSEVWEALRNAGERVGRGAKGVIRSQFRKRIRDPLNKAIARFLGDAFVYIDARNKGGAESPILKVILTDIDAAYKQSKETGEPLVVVAHSMGGNIMYDILTHFRPNTYINHFVTVGSQVAVLEELKLYKASDPNIPNGESAKVGKPNNIGAWLNVFDHSDVLGFAAGKVFSDVTDYEFDTGASLFGAHSAYFTKPSFHNRLNERITGAN